MEPRFVIDIWTTQHEWNVMCQNVSIASQSDTNRVESETVAARTISTSRGSMRGADEEAEEAEEEEGWGDRRDGGCASAESSEDWGGRIEKHGTMARGREE